MFVFIYLGVFVCTAMEKIWHHTTPAFLDMWSFQFSVKLQQNQ